MYRVTGNLLFLSNLCILIFKIFFCFLLYITRALVLWIVFFRPHAAVATRHTAYDERCGKDLCTGVQTRDDDNNTTSKNALFLKKNIFLFFILYKFISRPLCFTPAVGCATDRLVTIQ